jgi:hypothetical protein
VYLRFVCVYLLALHRASSVSSSSRSQSSAGVGAASSSSSDADTDDDDMLWGHELRQNDVGFETSLEQQVSLHHTFTDKSVQFSSLIV